MESYLLDTNVISRLIDRNDPQHMACKAAVETLIKKSARVCLAPQVLFEFWAVATRPAVNNGLGWTPQITNTHVQSLRKLFAVPSDTPRLLDEWQTLVTRFDVCGKRAHDARLAAFMRIHGIVYLLTLNGRDFQGWGLNVREPETLLN
ncbi:PIN domain nuclease [Acidiferrobacter sp. SPIII_3]|jgi:predicted nucleic acid-binding protein|uniref:type II toxin-antitoxin system VapC family toxin n=1 Tax=Acidiferrobacter sp. SPIII_3 TaxID=1281578 RepID=UPI000D736180|nr:type II toxin-antitoxin system VapC family toxin [Acidiferrobacter sp. SPIII_3]AWP22140.1 PIN domain nuclease [Acidiferrobacter sp. SPIII_3]